MWTALGVGISGSLLAASYVYWVTEHQLIPTLLIACAGVVSFLITLFFIKKKPEAGPPPPLLKDSGNATANATGGSASIGDINIHFPPMPFAAAAPAPAPEDIDAIRDNARREAMIIEYLRKNPNMGYDVKELSEVVNASMPDVRDIMERLKARRVVTTVSSFDAFGGDAYFIDPLHAPNPQPPQPPRAANTVKVAYRRPANPIEQEEQVMEFLKTADPQPQRRLRGASAFNDAELIAPELNFTFRDLWDTLERLEKKGRVCRHKADVRGGALWRLDDRED